MEVEAVMDTYLELGFITKCQYEDFCRMKQKLVTKGMDEKSIFHSFYEYLDILPMECEIVDMLAEALNVNVSARKIENQLQ